MLTPKKKQFAMEYLIDLNAKQAAIRSGYSARTAASQGQRLLMDADVALLIQKHSQKRAEKTNITAERVLQEIECMAMYDPAEFCLEHDLELSGRGDKFYGLTGPGDIKALPEGVRRAITGWSWDKAGRFVVKLADKSKALDQLARHLSLYNDKIAVDVTDALADRLARAKARAGK